MPEMSLARLLGREVRSGMHAQAAIRCEVRPGDVGVSKRVVATRAPKPLEWLTRLACVQQGMQIQEKALKP